MIQQYRTLNGTNQREWVLNVLIIGDPIWTVQNDAAFLPSLAQLYQQGDPDVLESLRDYYPELKPVVEDYIKYLNNNGNPATYKVASIPKADTTKKSLKDYLPWILGGTAAVLLIYMATKSK